MLDVTKTNTFILYTTDKGDANVQIIADEQNETIWVTQKQMSDIFDANVRTINEHLQNIFISEELLEYSVIRNFRITANDGKTYNVNILFSVNTYNKSTASLILFILGCT